MRSIARASSLHGAREKGKSHPADSAPRCLKCGYNLFGISIGVCPECGTRVSLASEIAAQRRRRLQDRPDNARTIAHTASSLFAIVTLAGCIGIIAFTCIQRALSPPEWDALDPLPMRQLTWLAAICFGVVLTLYYLVNRHYTKGTSVLAIWMVNIAWATAGMLMLY